MQSKRRMVLAGTAIAVAAMLGIGLWSGGGAEDANTSAISPDDDSAGHSDAIGDPAAPEAGGAAASDEAGNSFEAAAVRRPDGSREVIRTAQLTLETSRSESTVRHATQIVDAAGGFLFSEEADRTSGGMVLSVYKVPPDRFDDVLEQFEKLGDVRDRHIATDDVTGQVVDLEARLASTRTSVERLRTLLTTSGGVADLLNVEQSLAERESQMESLDAQLTALQAQVDMATITLSVIEPAPETKPAAKVDHDIPGFVEGLRRGGAAFVNGFLVVSTGVGMALPFAAFALGVAIPVRIFTRRRRTLPA